MTAALILLAAAWVGLLLGWASCVIGTRFPAPPLDETAETFDASLLPLSDSEVARALRAHMSSAEANIATFDALGKSANR